MCHKISELRATSMNCDCEMNEERVESSVLGERHRSH